MMGLGISLLSSVSQSPVASGNFQATGDTVHGVYTLNGQPAEIGDIIDIAQSTPFDPDVNVDASGLIPTANADNNTTLNLYLEPATVAAALQGITVVVEFFDQTGNFSPGFALLDSMTGNQTILFIDHTGYFFRTADFSRWQPDVDHGWPTGQNSKMAFTITNEEIAICINGGVIDHYDVDAIEPEFDAAMFQLFGTGNDRLTGFQFYTAVDDSQLVELSS